MSQRNAHLAGCLRLRLSPGGVPSSKPAQQCTSCADHWLLGVSLVSLWPFLPPTQVSARAKKRGLPQMGTLGAGNHYAEIQVRARWARWACWARCTD